MEGQVGRFEKKFSFLFPFTSVSHLSTGHERGTKIRKGQENAQMADRKGRETKVFLPCRGTNFEKTSKNAHDTLQGICAIKRAAALITGVLPVKRTVNN